MTATTTTKAPKLTDAQLADLRVRILKDGGATWRSIADLMGFGWNGANMDGGRAKRAYNRAVKAELNRELTKTEQTWIEKVGKPGAKIKSATPAKAAPAKRTAKAKSEGRIIPTLEECAVRPLTTQVA